MKVKQCKQKTSQKSYQAKINYLANLRLAAKLQVLNNRAQEYARHSLNVLYAWNIEEEFGKQASRCILFQGLLNSSPCADPYSGKFATTICAVMKPEKYEELNCG